MRLRHADAGAELEVFQVHRKEAFLITFLWDNNGGNRKRHRLLGMTS